ncbi:hypothetical protein [Nocardia seriolae]|nr:hypothetical protein [Nocardia seriolae]WNJ57917.1 hypothetical protein RMO66_31755 [Nocardia seriolae]BAW04824.1 hypothetical protein NSERUTF1_1613 [Nocardia seriolae]GAM46510.1 hypothetical protein NS07_v2contig00031-0055 [Nocardia seriolae]
MIITYTLDNGEKLPVSAGPGPITEDGATIYCDGGRVHTIINR